MASWELTYYTHNWTAVQTLLPINPVVVCKHKDVSEFTCEWALSDPFLTRDLIGPDRNFYILTRNDVNIIEGELKEVSLAGGRDTLLLQHNDFLGYLNDRYFPFEYPFTFGDWPHKWTAQDLTTIVESMLTSMVGYNPTGATIPCPNYVFSNAMTGTTTNYLLHAGDRTKILQHIKTLSEQDDGFDFRARKEGNNIRFNMTSPGYDDGNIVYTLNDSNGQIDEDSFQWKNTGPEATRTVGLGAGSQNKSRAYVSTYGPSVDTYMIREDMPDFGEVRNYEMLHRLTASEGFRQRFPQKECSFRFLVDTQDLPNFWAQSLGRPYSLLGRRVHVGPILFRNYHEIDADFKILDFTLELDDHGNEFCAFGLDMING